MMRTALIQALLILAFLGGSTTVPAAEALRFRTVAGIGGVPLNVVEAGDPGAPGILLVHGIGQSTLSFERQFDSFLPRRLHLVAFDLRGHGNSGKPWNREAYTDSAIWAGDVDRVRAATGLDRFVLLGWSYGTGVVTDYLRHYGTVHLTGLVLVGSFGGLTPLSPEASGMIQQLRQQEASCDLEANIAVAREGIRFLTAEPMSSEWVERATIVSMMLPAPVRGYMFDRSFANQDLLPRIDVPLLLMLGSKDPSAPAKLARGLAGQVPDGRVAVYPGSGHSPFVEDAERFNADLAAFVEDARRLAVGRH